MERQQELKVLLKRWEAEFLRERRRKPSQADIEEAPPETRRLYQEYARLKKAGKSSECSGKTSEFSGFQEIPKAQQVQDLGFWGSHLNRAPKIPGKIRNGNPRPGISAEFYGMKLKAKLGTTGKEPPLTLRTTPNPRRTPKIPQSQKSPEPPEKSENPKKSENPEEFDDLVLPPSVPGLGPLKFPTNPKFSPVPEKFQRLKEKVAKTLGSLDPGWIERCQEFLEKTEEFPEKSKLGTENQKMATENQKMATEKTGLVMENRKSATKNRKLASENRKSTENRKLAMENQKSATGSRKLASENRKLASENRKSATGNRKSATENRKLASENRKSATENRKLASENRKSATGNRKLASGNRKSATENRKLATEKMELVMENPEFLREKGEIPESLGNSARKRPREGGGAAEIPAKLRKGLREENLGILGMRENLGGFGMREVQEGNEDEGERSEFRSGAGKATKRSGKKVEEEEKSKPARKARAPPGNFVRLNLKRKTFSRGSQRGKFLRKQVWRQKWRKKFGVGGDRCFRCGGTGHWASECTGKDLGSFSEEIPEDQELLPTLDEVAQRSSGVFIPEIPDVGCSPENSQDFLQEFSPPPPPVDPLYPPNPDGTIPDPPEEVLEALKILGYESFRPGQAEAVMRVLSGISTLLVLPTGTGKSLCYQLPAFLYHRNSGAIALVISPLVSLMDDQICGLPSALSAVRIHSNLTPSQRQSAMQKIRSGQAQILLLSPESLVASGSFRRFFRDFPPVAFACLDEAHCISQWSHNFRPAYLRVCKLLRERLAVSCFLGLTATATAAAAGDISQHLGIAAQMGAGAVAIPKNLRLSASLDPERDQALLELLQAWTFGNPENSGNSGNFGNSGNSVLVFCTRREECERLAALIQREFAELPEKWRQKTGKGKSNDFRVAAAYHAGLCPRERRKIQKDFMGNGIRVLCATISFGMGLDKSGIGGVVHYNIPGSLEGYVQEIGRAGRDGGTARCHLFLQPQGQDLLELRRHIHENSVDFLAVKTLIQRVFAPCKCLENHGKIQENSQELPKNSRICRGHERSIPIQEFVESLDLREEGIETLLTLLELQPQKFLELLPPVLSRCRIRIPANSAESLREAALRCPPLGFLLARKNLGISGTLEFDAVALSDSMGWEFWRLRESLRKIPLEARKGKSRIQVEFLELSFHFRAYGDLNSQELDSCWEFLNSQIISREKFELRRLQRCFRTFQSVAFPSFFPEPPEQEQLEKNSQLRELIQEYFQRDPKENEEEEEEENSGIPPDQEEEIRAEIRKFLAAYPDEEFSGRAVARIFHGIGSPRFPARIFGRDRRFWRRLLPLPFRSLSRLASQEILAWR